MLSILNFCVKYLSILALISSLPVIFILNRYIYGMLIFISIIALIYIGIELKNMENVMYQIYYCTFTLFLSIIILVSVYKNFIHFKRNS